MKGRKYGPASQPTCLHFSLSGLEKLQRSMSSLRPQHQMSLDSVATVRGMQHYNCVQLQCNTAQSKYLPLLRAEHTFYILDKLFRVLINMLSFAVAQHYLSCWCRVTWDAIPAAPALVWNCRLHCLRCCCCCCCCTVQCSVSFANQLERCNMSAPTWSRGGNSTIPMDRSKKVDWSLTQLALGTILNLATRRWYLSIQSPPPKLNVADVRTKKHWEKGSLSKMGVSWALWACP